MQLTQPRLSRNLVTFMVGDTSAGIGNSMTVACLPLAMLHSGYEIADVGLVLAARSLSNIALLVVGGVLGDHFSRRYLMIIADATRVACLGGVGWILFQPELPVAYIMIVAAMSGLADAIFLPAAAAIVPELASGSELVACNAILSSLQAWARIVGPLAAIGLLSVLPPAAILLVNSLTYLLSLVSISLLRRIGGKRKSSSERVRLLTDIRWGWRSFVGHRWILRVTIHFMLFNLVLWGPYQVLGPVISTDRWSDHAWPMMLTAYGLGATVAGLLLLRLKPSGKPLTALAAATILWLAPSLLLSTNAPLFPVLLAAGVAGVANGIFNTYWTSLLQSNLNSDELSRVTAFVVTGAGAVMPLGLALAAPLTEVIGYVPVLVVGVLIHAVSALALVQLSFRMPGIKVRQL